MSGKMQRRGSPRGPRGSWLRRGLALGVCVTCCACAGGRAPSRTAGAPPASYDAEQATLFGDLLRPELFGLNAEHPPEQDGLLRDRALHADAVVPARVVTLSLEDRGATRTISLVITATESALVGTTPEGAQSFTVGEASPIYGWLRSAGDQWVGTRLLLFYRSFSDAPHFFGTPDTPAVRALVEQVKLLRGAKP